jgi:hypothetical protein
MNKRTLPGTISLELHNAKLEAAINAAVEMIDSVEGQAIMAKEMREAVKRVEKNDGF